MNFVFEGVCACDENVINVNINGIETTSYFVHKALEGLCCVAETKGHLVEFKQTKRGSNGGLTNVVFSHRYLVVRSNEVNLGEDGFTVEAGGEILNVWNWVLVGNSDTIEATIVAAWTPITRLRLGNHVKWRSPRTAGWSNNSLVQHMLKLVFSDLESFWWKAPRSSRARWSACKDVVGDVVFNRSLFGCWSGNVWVLAEDCRERSCL